MVYLINMKKIVGVMGSGSKEATETDLNLAYDIGKIIAELGVVLLCGGKTGVMNESAKGAKENGVLTVALGPGLDKSELNDYIDIPIMTGMHSGRNFPNILSSDVLVFVSVGSPGTLTELAFAIQYEKPSVVINGTDKLRAYIDEISDNKVLFVNTIEEVQTKLRELL